MEINLRHKIRELYDKLERSEVIFPPGERGGEDGLSFGANY